MQRLRLLPSGLLNHLQQFWARTISTSLKSRSKSNPKFNTNEKLLKLCDANRDVFLDLRAPKGEVFLRAGVLDVSGMECGLFTRLP